MGIPANYCGTKPQSVRFYFFLMNFITDLRFSWLLVPDSWFAFISRVCNKGSGLGLDKWWHCFVSREAGRLHTQYFASPATGERPGTGPEMFPFTWWNILIRVHLWITRYKKCVFLKTNHTDYQWFTYFIKKYKYVIIWLSGISENALIWKNEHEHEHGFYTLLPKAKLPTLNCKLSSYSPTINTALLNSSFPFSQKLRKMGSSTI